MYKYSVRYRKPSHLNTKEKTMTTKTDNDKMYLCKVTMELEFYDDLNQTWENCSSKEYKSNIMVLADSLEKFCEYDAHLPSEFFEWYVWMDIADRQGLTVGDNNLWCTDNFEDDFVTTDELFSDPDTMRIVDCNVEVMALLPLPPEN